MQGSWGVSLFMNPANLNIPVDILPLEAGKLLVLLKARGGWYVKVDIRGWAQQLGVSTALVKRWVGQLVDLGWLRIGTNPRVLFLKSWKFIPKRMKVGVRVDFILENAWNTARYWLVLVFLMRIHSCRKEARYAAIKRMWRQNKRHVLLSVHSGGISCSLAAKFLGISKTSSWRLRKKLVSMGLISVTPRWIKRPDLSVEAHSWLKSLGEAGRYKVDGGIVFERVTSYLELLQ